MQGDITCISDGRTVTFTVERNADAQTNPTQQNQSQAEEDYYIGNINSKKFHRPSCAGLPREDNRILFDTREDAINADYDPCGNCKP